MGSNTKEFSKRGTNSRNSQIDVQAVTNSVKTDALRAFYKDKPAMTKYPPFLDGCPKFDFDATLQQFVDSDSPNKNALWSMLAGRIMSPFKEFVKFAKRQNKLSEVQEDLNDENRKQIQLRIKSKSRRRDKVRKNVAKLRQQFQNSHSNNNNNNLMSKYNVSFQIEDPKSSSKIGSLENSKNEEQITEALQQLKYNINNQLQSNIQKTRNCSHNFRENCTNLDIVKEVDYEKDVTLKGSPVFSLIKKVENGIQQRVLESIEKYKKQKSRLLGKEEESNSQKVFDLSQFIQNFQKTKALIDSPKIQEKKDDQLINRNNSSSKTGTSFNFSMSKKSLSIIRLYPDEFKNIQKRPNKLAKIEKSIDNKITKISALQNKDDKSQNSFNGDSFRIAPSITNQNLRSRQSCAFSSYNKQPKQYFSELFERNFFNPENSSSNQNFINNSYLDLDHQSNQFSNKNTFYSNKRCNTRQKNSGNILQNLDNNSFLFLKNNQQESQQKKASQFLGQKSQDNINDKKINILLKSQKFDQQIHEKVGQSGVDIIEQVLQEKLLKNQNIIQNGIKRYRSKLSEIEKSQYKKKQKVTNLFLTYYQGEIGRGGASLTFIGSTENEVTLLLACGASREQQFDDFWTIKIDRKTFEATSAQQLKITERDEFTARNSMTSIFDKDKNRVIFFGGQDSENFAFFQDVYILDLEKMEMKHQVYTEGQVVPQARNSHTISQVDNQNAIIFGGANSEGPLKDVYQFNLSTLEFKQIKLDEQTHKIILPQVEMHSTEIYKNESLLVIGGRGIFPGQKIEEAGFQNIIYSIGISEGENQGKVSQFGSLPSDLCSHVSALIDDEYLIVYGGTNGLRFFDSIMRYKISEKKWTLMTKQPQNCKKSRFFQDGRISSCSVLAEDLLIIYGGSSIEKECNDFLILPVNHLKDDKNFSEINEIM